MKFYYDLEFTGLHKDTSLISIGIMTERNDIFYAELTDYDKNQVNDWINENVIDNLLLTSQYTKENIFKQLRKYLFMKRPNDVKTMLGATLGDKDQVKQLLLKWINAINPDTVNWVSDVCHYDFVLLIDLLYGNALSIPDNHSKWCYDINQDLCNYYNDMKIPYTNAFDLCREELIDKEYLNEITRFFGEKGKHNALFDAMVIKRIDELGPEKWIGNKLF